MDRRQFLRTSAISATAVNLAASNVVAASADEAGPGDDPVARLTANLNPSIQHAREVALRILKPSARDLEHGLALHADAVVFDAYGFSPRAAVDGDVLAAAVEAGASAVELKDMREDMSMTRYVSDPVEQKEYLDAWRASGVTCIYQNAGEEGQDPLRLIKRLSHFTFATDMLKQFVSRAAVPDDITEAKRQGRHCLYLTGNGVPLTQQWLTIEDELRYVNVFFHLGIRMMHLTYQRRNMIGDGCGEPGNAGLSDFGRSVIAEMNRIGITPDCAHSGWQTSLEAAQVSSRPVVASHSVCGGIYAHIRSKPDDVIRAIADTGGYIGICCIPRYLRGSGDITALLDHIDYVVKKFGIDHVAIGTDVSYTSQNSSAEAKKVPRSPKGREEFRSLWPKDDFQTTADMTSSIAWTNWPLFTVGLVQRGYSDDDIRKVLAGNVLRVARDSLSARD
ncbi:MAG: membrane dipeptidase [Planctomycetaceae bacterium]